MAESNVTARPEKGTECLRLQGELDEDEVLVALVHQRSDEQRSILWAKENTGSSPLTRPWPQHLCLNGSSGHELTGGEFQTSKKEHGFLKPIPFLVLYTDFFPKWYQIPYPGQ